MSVRRPPLIASFGLLPSGNSFTPDLQTRADAEQVMVLVERRVCECQPCSLLARADPSLIVFSKGMFPEVRTRGQHSAYHRGDLDSH